MNAGGLIHAESGGRQIQAPVPDGYYAGDQLPIRLLVPVPTQLPEPRAPDDRACDYALATERGRRRGI